MSARRDETRNQHEMPNSSSASNFHDNDDTTESLDLVTQREKIQQQILALEKYFDAEGHSGLSVCSSTDGESEDGDEDLFDVEKGLDAQHLKIQREIKELEETLGLGTEEHLGDNVGSSDIPMSEEDSDDEGFELPMNAETCLEMNLVYQEVVKEKLAELEQLLQDNNKQQKELESQMHGPAAPNPTTGLPSSKVMFIGYFMKPYFKDKVTGLGPPANPETKEKMLSGTHPCDEKSIRRWEGWQKSLLLSAIVQDTMKRLLQPKLSKMEYLRDKASKAEGMERETLQKQIDELDAEIGNIRALSEEDLMGARNDDHDWEKIANIDFEGKREAEDIKLFWQNYLHPCINKSSWKPDEIEKLKSIVEEHQGHNWETIAEKLETNRTAFMCFQTHQRYIYKEFRKRAWTKEEDDQLRDLVQKKRIGNFIPYTQTLSYWLGLRACNRRVAALIPDQWTMAEVPLSKAHNSSLLPRHRYSRRPTAPVSYFLDGRDASQLIYRWTQVLDPSIRKGPWSKQEDKLLLKAVEKHGIPNWWRIRYEVPGRTDSQCRDRYLDCLSDDVRKGPWSEEEENMLKLAVQKYGIGKWAKIATEIPYRIDSQCMQKWKSLTKRTIPKRSYPNSVIHKFMRTRQKPRGKKKKKRKRNVLRKVKDEDDQSGEEEIEYIDSDAEGVGEKDADSEEEPQLSKVKFIQTPLSEWIPRQTGKTMPTTEGLRMFLVKTPEDTEEMHNTYAQFHFKSPARYTILNNLGFPVNRIKRYQPIVQDHQTTKTRTFDEDMILVPQGDVKKLFQSVVTRAFKLRLNEKESAVDPNRPESQQGQSKSSGTGPGEVTFEETGEVSAEGPNEDSSEDPNEGSTEDTGEGTRKRSSLSVTQGRVEVRPIICSQYLLKAAISPWMGHLLLPLPRSERQKIEADIVRERAAKVDLSSTEVFSLLLKVLNIDTVGCKKVISNRKDLALPKISHKRGAHSPALRQMVLNSTVKQTGQTKSTNLQPFQPSPIRQQQLQQVLIPILQTQHPHPKQTQLPHHLEAPKASLKLPLQGQPCGKAQTQPQLRIPQMPQLFIPPGVQLAQPMLMALTQCGKAVASPITSGNSLSSGPVTTPSTCSKLVATQSTCSEPVSSQSTQSEPVSVQATCTRSPSSAEAEATRSSKRARKPTDKAKLLMEETSTKTKAQQRHKRPRLEGPTLTPQPASPVTWIITPSAQVPMNTLNSSKPVGTSLLPCPPASSTTSSNPAISSSTTTQANIPLNITNMFPGAVVLTLSNVPVSTPVTTPSSVSASTSNTTVTTSLPGVQGRCSSASPTMSHIPASTLATSPALSSTPVRALGPQSLQGSPRLFASSPAPVQKTPPPLHPMAGVFRTLTPVVTFPQPAVQLPPPGTQKQIVLPDFAAGSDPSLMFMEDKNTIQAWMKRRNATVASQSDLSQTYLPPFVSAMNTLHCLLMAKTSLLKHSLRILPNSPKEATSNRKTAEQVDAVRSLVREKFSSNPAYQTLKARFLSCFAMPALLATIDPTKDINESDDENDSDDNA